MKDIIIAENSDSIHLLIQRKDNVKIEDFSWINKYKFQNIKYEGFQTINENDIHGIFDIIIFKFSNEESQKFIKTLVEFMDDTLKNSIDLKQSLETIVFYFRKLKNDIDVKQLHGDIGEALFVLECFKIHKELGDKVLKAMHQNDDDPFDFSFKNNYFIDVKTTSKANSEINYSSNQIKSANSLVDLVVVKTRFLKNQKTILDIYNEISKYGPLNDFLESKVNLYSTQDELINNNSIDWDDVIIKFYNRDFLPKSDLKVMPTVKKITYTLDATNLSLDEKSFKQRIVENLK